MKTRDRTTAELEAVNADLLEALKEGVRWEDIKTERDRLKVINAELLEALIKLSNEVMGSAEMARPCIGNTNANCLLQRAEEARAASAKAEGQT